MEVSGSGDPRLTDALRTFQVVVMERNVRLAEDVLHPEFALVLVHPTPALMPRERWLAVLPDYIVHDWVVEETQTDVDDDCAAVLQRIRMQATVLGEARSGLFVVSDFWRDNGASWRIWRRHSSPLSASSLPGA